jgi:hypothetical protein
MESRLALFLYGFDTVICHVDTNCLIVVSILDL